MRGLRMRAFKLIWAVWAVIVLVSYYFIFIYRHDEREMAETERNVACMKKAVTECDKARCGGSWSGIRKACKGG